ncbi:hypothetical protein M501DRAFT_627327 [Patellaria atrata CBS 101060]|uniref:Uncharacterized protein n=1 Tax=Patellaria atrata CBS 101060 TaxID=1346257 RepID=A0A9P4VR92_9PEZI|nr:hypothetical protein M501DRAFT_627327 [Patellaria atrata CBS 101060]
MLPECTCMKMCRLTLKFCLVNHTLVVEQLFLHDAVDSSIATTEWCTAIHFPSFAPGQSSVLFVPSTEQYNLMKRQIHSMEVRACIKSTVIVKRESNSFKYFAQPSHFIQSICYVRSSRFVRYSLVILDSPVGLYRLGHLNSQFVLKNRTTLYCSALSYMRNLRLNLVLFIFRTYV